MENPFEGRNRFYDKSKPQDEIDGLEYAIRETEKSIRGRKYDPQILKTHLAALKKELQKAKKKLSGQQ